VLIGLGLPFWNLYLTWWLYTLGGKLPIPEAHTWLVQTVNKKTKTITTAGIMSLTVVGVSLGQFVYRMYFKHHDQQVLLFFQILIPLIVFGMALTLGTALKRKQFLLTKSVPN
jgi:hypothetical protein